MVLNDEAHHVDDDDLAWGQSLLAIQRALPNGLSLRLDFSATPKPRVLGIVTRARSGPERRVRRVHRIRGLRDES